MDSNKIKIILVVILAAFGALYLGVAAATAQIEAVAWILGGLVLTICLALGRRIWLLIPFMGALALSVRLPGKPSTILIAQILFIGFSTLLLLMRRLPYRIRFTELEILAILLTIFVFQAYARNPVGLNIFGGDTVGGRPYMLFIVNLMTAALLSGILIAPGEFKWVIRLSIVGGLLSFCISTIGRVIPSVGFLLGASYEDTSVQDHTSHGMKVDTGEATREGFLGKFGRNLSLLISTFKSPLLACFHPLLAPVVLVSLAAAAMSGYRNEIAAVGMTYFIGVCYRGGIAQVLSSSLVGLLVLAGLAALNAFMPLPPNIQRSLAFLPGSWEKRYIEDGANSTDWRVELWKEALISNRWISNRMFGDGLGFTMQELQYQISRQEGVAVQTLSGFDVHRDALLANGDYHSGPVQTIRTIGYAGLFVLLLFQVRLAVHAHRQIIRSRGTEWFPVALFIGIPLIWGPVFFVFINGTFTASSATLLIGTAMVRLLENNLPLPACIPMRERSYVPLAVRTSITTG